MPRLAALLTVVASLFLLDAGAALAHDGHFVSAPGPLGVWNLDPKVLLPLLALTVLYIRGIDRLGTGARRRFRWREQSFYAGMLLVLIALTSPLDYLGLQLASAHMAQHMVLLQLAAPLLAFGAPTVVMPLALPAAGRRLLGRARRSLLVKRLTVPTQPGPILALHLGVVLAWHVPALYNLGLTSSTAHALQHVLFLGTAFYFWRAVLPDLRGGIDFPTAAGLLFTMTLATGALGAVMTLSPSPWYAYAPHVALTALEDQQIAGALMWVAGGMTYGLILAALFVIWLSADEKRGIPPRRTASPAKSLSDGSGAGA